MDERADRGEFYPGGDRSGGAPAPQSSDKVDRVNVGEVGESYTLKDVKNKVNQIVRVIAPAAVCLALCARAATAPLEDIPNTAPVVTNEEDSVALATLGTATNSLLSRMSAGMSELRSDMNTASNKLASAISESIAAESNRVESTYAKRSEIPAAPDLAPYALKSELPQDYLREGDITNFATRAWINSQGYATEGTVYARIDAQNLALGAATNEMWQAMKSGTNKLWEAHGAASNRLNMATNALWNAHSVEANALRATDTAHSNRLEQATRTGDGAWRAGTNALWYAMKEGTNKLWAAHAAASNRVNAATNAIWIAHKADANALRAADAAASNRVNAATNAIWIAHKADANALWAAHLAERARLDTATNALGSVLGDSIAETSNRLDAATNELMRAVRDIEIAAADSNAVTRLVSPDHMTWQDATGCVWEVSERLGGWIIPEGAQCVGGTVRDVDWSEWQDPETYEAVWVWRLVGEDDAEILYGETNWNARIIVHGDDTYIREVAGRDTNLVKRVAYTNDLERAAEVVMEWVTETLNSWREMGTVYAAKRLVDDGGMYGEVTPSNVWETAAAVTGKQDALPYPTNAIPYTAISGAPSGGGQEWRVDNQQSYGIHYVTNGMANVEMGAELSCNTNGWCDGAAMFVRFRIASGVAYEVMDDRVRLVGYGTWPTNNFQSVWWRSGATIYVNILVED